MHSCLELQAPHLAFRPCASPPARPEPPTWRKAAYSAAGWLEARHRHDSKSGPPVSWAASSPPAPLWDHEQLQPSPAAAWSLPLQTKVNGSEHHGSPPLQKEPPTPLYPRSLLATKPGSPAEQPHGFQRWNASGPSLEEGDLLPMYGGGGRPSSSGSSSSAGTPSPMLAAPQPLKAANGAATANTAPHGHPTQPRKYQCKMCPQMFDAKAELQLHAQSHLREAKPYRCAQCSKAFANASYLSQHARIHSGVKPYRCDLCDRKFTQLSHLQQHVRTHTGDKPYLCRHPGCDKAFSQLSNLQSHSRCHQADKPFKCHSCYKCFAHEDALLEHIPRHRDSKHLKTHICPRCGKSYTQETYLLRHMQRHAHPSQPAPPSALAPPPPLSAPSATLTWPEGESRLPHPPLQQQPPQGANAALAYCSAQPVSSSAQPQYEPKNAASQLISLHHIRNFAAMPPTSHV
ncbi:uncharacterized protein [Dermacentor andersoni]|uniref:uncharacterized protein isoform X2 n=1 Tax=Dermacentor andersoni TaxID=34620 RepID=UPI002417B7C0|nr:zinc finger protein rotund-like isoform X2 [Dermacentor andersoni]